MTHRDDDQGPKAIGKPIGLLLLGAVMALVATAFSGVAAADARSDKESVADPAEGRVAMIPAGYAHKSEETRSRLMRRGKSRARKRCRRGYKRVRVRRGRVVCKRRATSTPASTPPSAPPSTPAPGQDLSQQILDDTFSLAVEYGEQAINSNIGLPRFYKYLIHPEDCRTLSADTASCLVYMWQLEEGSGYGWGGYDAAIYRESYMATRVGDRIYQPRIVQIDFMDPYQWVCSDTPRHEVPACSS